MYYVIFSNDRNGWCVFSRPTGSQWLQFYSKTNSEHDATEFCQQANYG